MTKKFLVIGQRGGFFHIRAQRDTHYEATALAASCAHVYGGGVQMTFLVAEVQESFKSSGPYTRKRSK